MKTQPEPLSLHDVVRAGVSIADVQRGLAARMRARDRRRGGSVVERAARLRAVAPGGMAAVIVAADEAMRGMMVHPGTDAKLFFVGNPPAWNTNPTKDEEYVWGLNRMMHWKTLLRAHALTGDDRYARKVVEEVVDWIDACPCPPIEHDRQAAWRSFYAVTPWRSLEAGIRMYESWPVVFEHLAGTPWLSDALLTRMVRSLHDHARVLAEICPIFWPEAAHNHYLMENLGLLSICAVLPELAGADAWRARAVHELERCANAQLTADGGQIEGCPMYHGNCVYWFCLAIRLAEECGVEMPAGYRERLMKAVAYAQHSTRPTGDGVPWGDSDPMPIGLTAAIWWMEVTGDGEALRRLAILTGPDVARAQVIGLAWEIGDVAGQLRAVGEAPAAGFPNVHWQHELSQVSLRSGWDRAAASVFVACRSPSNNGHAHLDPGGFDFCAYGQALVVDPGRYTYRNCPERYTIKRASWHNTITVDGRDPFAFTGTWSFGPQQDGRITDVVDHARIKAAVCRQLNFTPAVHRRLVALIDDLYLLVIDEVTGIDAAARVQIHHHIDSTDVAWDGVQARAGFADGVGAVIAASDGLDGVIEDGMVSTAMDVWHPSRRLSWEDRAGETVRRHAVVVVPWRGRAPVVVRPRVRIAGEVVVCDVMMDGRGREVSWSADGVECR